jgi:hypothetical protein
MHISVLDAKACKNNCAQALIPTTPTLGAFSDKIEHIISASV